MPCRSTKAKRDIHLSRHGFSCSSLPSLLTFPSYWSPSFVQVSTSKRKLQTPAIHGMQEVTIASEKLCPAAPLTIRWRPAALA